MSGTNSSQGLFSPTEANLGTVQGGSKHKVTFSYNGAGKITSVKAGCGCTVPSFSSSSVNASFTPARLAAGVVGRLDRKKITVTVTNPDGSTETHYLYIVADVK